MLISQSPSVCACTLCTARSSTAAALYAAVKTETDMGKLTDFSMILIAPAPKVFQRGHLGCTAMPCKYAYCST